MRSPILGAATVLGSRLECYMMHCWPVLQYSWTVKECGHEMFGGISSPMNSVLGAGRLLEMETSFGCRIGSNSNLP